MQYVQIGATGVYVSRIPLGAMTFGGAGTPPWSLVGGLDEKAADELVGLALDAGVNLIDTADMYAAGECEEILGRVLGARRGDVLLATKLFARMGTGPNDLGLSRLWVTRALEDSLRRLRTDHIDLYQIHSFDPLTPVEETLAALDDAVRQGKVVGTEGGRDGDAGAGQAGSGPVRVGPPRPRAGRVPEGAGPSARARWCPVPTLAPGTARAAGRAARRLC
ncbi:aldo/keto reductase [Streptomyces chartreusis]|uniref:aldo/keto reductase n=1 Tax=Streptomyces chartreusis TaxID=1969 RepID=UPI0036A0B0A1